MIRDRRMSADQVEAILRRYGFTLISQKGSHRKWRNSERQLQAIVPHHKGRDLPMGTLRSDRGSQIIRLTVDEAIAIPYSSFLSALFLYQTRLHSQTT
jgi:predicted RNA binding protein YcfA (HicA-like mRNA interferase family)